MSEAKLLYDKGTSELSENLQPEKVKSYGVKIVKVAK